VLPLDERVFRAVYGGAGAGGLVYGLMVALTAIGSGWSMLLFLPFLARPATRRFGATLLVTLAVTSLLVFLVKVGVQRPRPCMCLPDVHALCFTGPTDPSFPSGHAAGAFAFAAFVGTWLTRQTFRLSRKLLGLGALGLLALGIALSRVYLGVHFPSDVTAGALLGAAVGYASARFIHVRSEPKAR
jgi:undecaprenyl-diphosphatase